MKKETGKRAERRSAVGERKKRVLHTRISEQLAEDITRVADDLRVPVSNLVRNVLEDAFSMVESMTDNVGDLIDNVLDEADRARERITRSVEGSSRSRERSTPVRRTKEARADSEKQFADIIGWQPMLLNGSHECSRCGRSVARGTRGAVGVGVGGLTTTVLCTGCLRAMR